MSEEIIEKIKICLKDENSVIAFLKKISKVETLKNIREKCNKITENYQFVMEMIFLILNLNQH